MKRILIILSLLAVLCSAMALPPVLPVVAYGETNAPGRVTVTNAESGALLASAKVWDWNGLLVYRVDILMDGIPCGTVANFALNGVILASRQICSGMSIQVNLFMEVKDGR